MTSRFELSLRCENLVDMDLFSKSDPCVQVFKVVGNNSNPKREVLLGETEVVWNNLNPKFTKTFMLDYYFEEVQNLLFKVFDVDHETGPRTNRIGDTQCTVAELVMSPGQCLSRPLMWGGQVRGTIYIRVEEAHSIRDMLTVGCHGINIPLSLRRGGSVGLLAALWGLWERVVGRAQTFLVISRSCEDGSWLPIAQTVPGRAANHNNHNTYHQWPPLVLSVQKLCNGDPSRTIKLEVWSFRRSGSHVLVGQAETTLENLQAKPLLPLTSPTPASSTTTNHSKHNQQGQHQHPAIQIDTLTVEPKPPSEQTFFQYLQDGGQISLNVNIDFTSSNGEQWKRNSLHYGDSQHLSAYQVAIRAVGDILSYYDSDQRYPVYGFGAMIGDRVSHCFPLVPEVEVEGVDGICQAYRDTLSRIRLSGPTLFSHILGEAIKAATVAHHQALATGRLENYTIMLILTDGVISDTQDTINQIVHASSLPLSIVIVGIGNADFTTMNVLDADETPLIDSHGKKMERDIVQFVPFNEVSNNPDKLSKEVLAEIPDQLVSYLKSIKSTR